MICCLCVDADWAHPKVASALIDRLLDEGIPFTFFATEDQALLNHPNVEIAWHPNFERGPADEELSQMRRLFPDGKGLRPHRLAWGDCDEGHLLRYGICWTSSVYKPDDQSIIFESEVAEIPISWGDNWWFLKELRPSWERMKQNRPGCYVLNIHPIHYYLNTRSLEQYERAKSYNRSPQDLDALRNIENTGVANIVDEIIEFFKSNPELFTHMSKVIDILLYGNNVAESPNESYF